MKSMDDDAVQDLSDLIGLVYDSALEPNQWKTLLDRLCKMFPGHVGHLMTYENFRMMGYYSPISFADPSFKDRLDVLLDDGRPIADYSDAEAELAELNRKDPHYLGGVQCTRNWFTDEEYRLSAGYKTVMSQVGLFHWHALVFAMNGPRIAVLNLVELEAMADLCDHQGVTRTLNLISPHVVRGARIARALYMAKEAAETYKGFLDGIALPLIIVDGDGVLQVTNSAGQRLIDRGGMLSPSPSGQVALVQEHANSAFVKALREVGRDGDARGLIVEDGDNPVSLCIAPFHPAMMTNLRTEQDIFDKSQLYAVFFGTKGEEFISTGLLQDVFQLTHREAEVCSALVAGKPPAQIAEIQGRAEKTIRNQIQSVHEKVGVTSTRELSEALSVFRTVGAMFDNNDPHLFGPQKLPSH